jgi:hypothetical protein
MRISVLLLLGVLAFGLLVIPVVLTAPVAAQDVTVTETPVPDQNVTVAETPVPDQTVAVTETLVPEQTVAVTETPVPEQTVAVAPTTAVPGWITITLASDNADFNKLHIGDNDWTGRITIDTSYPSWYVEVLDDSGSASPGHMVQTSKPLVHLANPLLVRSIDTLSYGDFRLPRTIWTGTSPGTFTGTLSLRQHVEDTDPAGSYSVDFRFQGGQL